VEKVDWAPHAVVFPVDESVKLLATIHRRSKRTRSATPRLVSRKPRKRWGSCDAAGGEGGVITRLRPGGRPFSQHNPER
jgi:hypothetical protein